MPLVGQLSDGLESNVGTYGAGTVPQQAGKMMFLTGIATFNNQAGFHPLPLTDEVMVDSGYRQEGWKRSPGDAHAAVAHNQDRLATVNLGRCGFAQFTQSSFDAFEIQVSIEKSRQGGSGKGGLRLLLQPL